MSYKTGDYDFSQYGTTTLEDLAAEAAAKATIEDQNTTTTKDEDGNWWVPVNELGKTYAPILLGLFGKNGGTYTPRTNQNQNKWY